MLLSLQIFQRGLFPIPGRCWGSLYSPPKPHVGIAPCSKHEGYGSQEEEEKSCVGNNYAKLRLPLVQRWKQKARCPSVERHQPGPASFLGRGGGNFFFFFSMECFMNLCVSLCRGHANLLCMGSILVYVLLKRTLLCLLKPVGSLSL